MQDNGFYGSANFSATNSTSYGAAALVGVAKEIALLNSFGQPVRPGSLLRIMTSVLKIDVTAVPSGQTSYSAHLYGVTPPSAQQDNATWSLASADLPHYRGLLSLGTPANLGSALFIRTQYQDFDTRLADGRSSLWAQMLTAGAFTGDGVARQLLIYGVCL